ncbi:MAG TPA: hypothetical protein VHA73_11990 [Acidimicrobiales bacterium]|nr:hypothetical protein [Acidimicrobiales bacterium]
MTRLAQALRAWSPWAPGEALRWLVVALAGHGLWLAALLLARYEASFGGQIKWAILAVGGLLLAAYGHLTWLLRGRYAIGQRRVLLLPDDGNFLAGLGASAPAPAVAAAPTPSGAAVAVAGRGPAAEDTQAGAGARGGLVVAGAGLRRFHRPECALASAKGWPTIERDAALSAGQEPCGVCQP